MANIHSDPHLVKDQKGIKKPAKRRAKAGTKALREIIHFQKSTEKLIKAAPFKRLVKEIFAQFDSHRLRKSALEVLHVAVEDYAVILFRGCLVECLHAKRKTIMLDDMNTVKRLMAIMHGEADLNTEPVNPRFSAAHRRECNAKRRPSRPRKRKEPIVFVNADLSLHEDEEETGNLAEELELVRIEEPVIEMIVERQTIREVATTITTIDDTPHQEEDGDDWLQ